VVEVQPATVCRQCLSRALQQLTARGDNVSGAGRGGGVGISGNLVVVDVGLEAHLDHR
jgi:hypothetical protein